MNYVLVDCVWIPLSTSELGFIVFEHEASENDLTVYFKRVSSIF